MINVRIAGTGRKKGETARNARDGWGATRGRDGGIDTRGKKCQRERSGFKKRRLWEVIAVEKKAYEGRKKRRNRR